MGNHVAVDARRFLLKTTLIQLRRQVVNSCNPGSGGRAALMFFVVIFTAGDKSSQKGKLKANQIFFFLPYFYYNLQQEAVLVLRSGHIPVTFILNRIKVTTFFLFFFAKTNSYVFYSSPTLMFPSERQVFLRRT